MNRLIIDDLGKSSPKIKYLVILANFIVFCLVGMVIYLILANFKLNNQINQLDSLRPEQFNQALADERTRVQAELKAQYGVNDQSIKELYQDLQRYKTKAGSNSGH